MKCKYCGGERFIGKQTIHAEVEVIVDGKAEFVSDYPRVNPNYDIFDADLPGGPFKCEGCGAAYEDLDDGDVISGPEKGWVKHEDTSYTRGQLLDVLESYAKLLKNNKDTPAVLIHDLEKSVNHVLQQNGRSAEV